MARYLLEVRKLEKDFKNFEVKYIPHMDNTVVDQLSKLGSSNEAIPLDVILEQLHAPSIDAIAPTDVTYLERPPDWTEPFVKYLLDGTLPEDRVERKVVPVHQQPAIETWCSRGPLPVHLPRRRQASTQ